MGVNFDLPSNTENYLHRIGRSGRFGRKGVAINFVTNNDVRTMKDIERYYQTQIEEVAMDCMARNPGATPGTSRPRVPTVLHHQSERIVFPRSYHFIVDGLRCYFSGWG